MPWKDSITRHKIIQIKSNVILKGLVSLEILFDTNDVLSKVRKKNWEEDIRDCSIDAEQ